MGTPMEKTQSAKSSGFFRSVDIRSEAEYTVGLYARDCSSFLTAGEIFVPE